MFSAAAHQAVHCATIKAGKGLFAVTATSTLEDTVLREHLVDRG